MRVLFLYSTPINIEYSGAIIYSNMILQALLDTGYDVDIVYPNSASLLTKIRRFFNGQDYWYSPIEFINNDVGDMMSYDLVIYDHFRTCIALERWKHDKTNVIFSHNLESQNYKSSYVSASGLKKIIFRYLWIKTQKLESKYFPIFRDVFSINSFESISLQNLNLKTHTLFPHIFSESKKLPSKRDSTFLIIGSYKYGAKRRNLIRFIDEVWSTYVERYPNRQLLIAGSCLPSFDSERRGLIIVESPDDIEPYLCSAKALIAPENEGGGFKLKYLDALAFGIPVLTTTASLQGTGLNDVKGFFTADTPEEYMCQLEMLHNAELNGNTSIPKEYTKTHFRTCLIDNLSE